MTDAIDLTQEQRNQLSALLRRFLPGVAVWAYGSRVKWTARPNSDLDLVAFATPTQRPQVAELKDALAESNLPFPVDLHVWDDVPERFREIIRKEYVMVQEAKEPKSKTSMPGEWCNITLGQVTDFLSGGTPSKDAPQYWGGSIPWVSAKDMKRFRLDDTEDHVTEDGVANGTKLVPSDTVLLLARGMTLLNDVPICVVKKPMTFNQDVKALRPKPGVRNEFLPYLLLGNKERLLSLVDLAGHGTGRLNSDELKVLDVVLPPEPEQRAIADILGTLDDKIELNRRMNETLEAMARALFKSWFVDFDPVLAKAEGRTPGLPKPLADLFPDSFEDSELGEIPSGWEAATLSDLATLNPESWSNESRPEMIDYVDLSNTKWGRIEAVTSYSRDDAPSRAQRVLRPQDTIVGTVRPGNGSYALISADGLTGSTGFAVLRPNKREYAEFVYLAASAPENIERLAHLADGAAYPAVRPEVVAATPVVKPDAKVMKGFAIIAIAMLSKIAANEAQTLTLATLRDALLPKLISGELRVQDMNRFEKGMQHGHN
jgi:type I restriction enzyme, S subunit